ncbi:START domain-containing protein [soil metagenome]
MIFTYSGLEIPKYMKKILFLICCIIPSFSVFSQDCDLKVNKNGIKVYTCELNNSKFKAIKSTFQLNCTLSELAAALLDVENCGKWQYKTLKANILKAVNEKKIIYYTEVEAPVLTSNRDFVIQLNIEQNPRTKEMKVDLVSLPEYIPVKDGIIRVPYSKAVWNVIPLSTNILQVEYYIELDLGGDVPPWMVNMVAPKAPYETFKDLKAVIGNYKGKTVSFIKN